MTLALLLIVAFFALGLLAQGIIRTRICALCVAVSFTWASLLLAYWSGAAIDPAILGILMGGSTVGALYYLSARLQPTYAILKLPFFVTAAFAAYAMLRGAAALQWASVALIAGLWVVFGAVALSREHPGFRKATQKLIECCRNW